MRHSVGGYKLSRTKNERRRLLMILARDLILHGTVFTTRAKAKAVQPLVEKLITKAKDGSQAKVRQIFAVLADKDLTTSLVGQAATRFSKRTSGFTRIVKLGERRGDSAESVALQFVDAQELIHLEEKKEVKVEAARVPKKASEPKKRSSSTKKAK